METQGRMRMLCRKLKNKFNFWGEDLTDFPVHQETPDYFLHYDNTAPMNMGSFAICSTEDKELANNGVWFH